VSWAAQLDRKVAQQYRQLGIPLSEDHRPCVTDDRLLHAPVHLASGFFHSVYAVQARGDRGELIDGVFKPLRRTEESTAGRSSGIPRHESRTAARNLASMACAEALGFDVIVPTRLAVISTPVAGKSVARPRVGLFMARAMGETAAQAHPGTLLRPDVRREVTKLQLVDHLTAQTDRHSSNYFIHVDAHGRAKVTGIDNDQCFGAGIAHPHELSPDARSGDLPLWGTGMPPAVDRDMAEAFRRLSESDLRALLSGRLSPAEVDAAAHRLAAIQEHIDHLASTNLVIDPGDWAQPWVVAEFKPDNSYAARDAKGAAPSHPLRQG
jgi:hypothetical protein